MATPFCTSHSLFVALVSVCLLLTAAAAADLVEDLAFEWPEPLSADAGMTSTPESDEALPSARRAPVESPFGPHQMDVPSAVFAMTAATHGAMSVRPIALPHCVSWAHAIPPSHGCTPLRI